MKFSLAFLLFLPQLCIADNSIEDDLVFDDVGDESASTLTKSDSFIQHEDRNRELRHSDHRYWEHKLPNKKTFNKVGEGLLDVSHRNVVVGHVFKLEIPKYAFGENIQRYEAYVKGRSKGFPSWLYWDGSTNTLLGVPTKKDVGQHTVIIKAFEENGNVIENHFPVSVTNVEKFTKHGNKKNHCKDDQDPILSVILIDAKYENLNPKQRVEMLEKLAEFLRLDTNSLSIFPHSREKHWTVIQWQVGCDKRFWKNENLKTLLPEQSKNANLAKILKFPVIRWHVKTDTSKESALERNRRDTGSGDSLNGQEYDGYDDDNEDYDDDEDYDDEDVNKETATETNIKAQLPQVFKPNGVKLNTETESEHPHRHHHGVEPIDLKPTEENTIYSTEENTTTPITTVTFATSITSVAMNTTVVDTTTQTQRTFETSSSQVPTTTTTIKPTTVASYLPPVLMKRLQKIAVFAGKTKTFIIPEETFYDEIDGYTRNLHLSLDAKFDWLEFNNETQELYMIPVKKDISSHEFGLLATNSRGLVAKESVSIAVQQYSKRLEYEFHMYLDILHHYAFRTDVDWKFKVIENLVELFGDKDSSFITVTEIHLENHHRAIFSWTNSTLSKTSICPTEKIEQILQVLVDKDGNPSPRLRNIFLPAINVTGILNRPGEKSTCDESLIKYAKADFTTENPPENYNPILRNQIDRLDCTLGQLFVHKVPEDTFFDKKDGSTRNLHLSLRREDLSEIAPDNWLQFDSKNQEFYGIPMKSNVDQEKYILEARDKEGLSARDSLKVFLRIPKKNEYSVEFSMTLEIPYEHFAKSAKRKRLFVEKVAELFGDNDTSAISLASITRGSTVVTWRNTSLATHTCPNGEIEKLRKVVVKEDKTLTDRVDIIMGSNDFPVKQITLTPLGSCLGELTGIHKQDSFVPPFDDSRSVGASNDEYLITFVLPAIIILTMLILAGIIACILYKRRRSGKMSVSEQDDERQSFRNKGIPVIFQDELDEKPDPGNKSPIILKEEKPPLPPPEYQKSEDGADVPMLPKENSEEPYQPPPPFATNRDNNRQNRPKPTPTYRKPPPYVPP